MELKDEVEKNKGTCKNCGHTIARHFIATKEMALHEQYRFSKKTGWRETWGVGCECGCDKPELKKELEIVQLDKSVYE